MLSSPFMLQLHHHHKLTTNTTTTTTTTTTYYYPTYTTTTYYYSTRHNHIKSTFEYEGHSSPRPEGDLGRGHVEAGLHRK